MEAVDRSSGGRHVSSADLGRLFAQPRELVCVFQQRNLDGFAETAIGSRDEKDQVLSAKQYSLVPTHNPPFETAA